MQALQSVICGGPETLKLSTLEKPSPKPGEVGISIKAAGVNFPDYLVIQDLYQARIERPFTPGGEISGVIESVGEGVKHLKPGMRVFSLLPAYGGFATHVCVPAEMVQSIDDDIPFDQGAGFVLTYGTSYYALKDRAQLQAGETLLILGAAGGVGSAAIELGKALGAKVIAAVSSEAKAEFCKSIGADETIIYPADMSADQQRALAKTFKAAQPNGVDVIYDAIGGDYAEPALRNMAWGGRYLVIGFPAGIPSIPINLCLLKSCSVVGVFWGESTARHPELHASNVQALLGMIADGKIKPRITARYPLAEGHKALQAMGNREVTGKVVITMDEMD